MMVSWTIWSVSPDAPITRFTMLRSGVESSTERNTTTSSRLGVANAGSRQQWIPVSGISSSPPNTALLTNRKSPTSRVFSMLAEGMRKASTRYDRSTIQIRSAVGPAEIGDLVLMRAVAVHDPDFHAHGPHQILRDQAAVIRGIRGGLRMPGAIDDLLAVGREERAAVVAEGARQALQVAAIHTHRVDVEVATPQRREHDRLPVRGERPFRIVPGIVRDASSSLTVRIRDVDVVIVQRPHVALGIVGTRRACRAGVLRRRVEDSTVVVEEVAARGAALAIGDAMEARPVGIHHELLIAPRVRFLPLKNDLMP